MQWLASAVRSRYVMVHRETSYTVILNFMPLDTSIPNFDGNITATLSLRKDWRKDNSPVSRAFSNVQCKKFRSQSVARSTDTEIFPKVLSTK